MWNIGAVEIAKTDEQDEITMDVGAIDIGGAAVKMHGCRNQGALPAGIGKVESMDVDGGTKGKSKNHKDQNQDKPIKITLDSGVGASCWPEKLWNSIPMNPTTRGVRISAAHGPELKYYGNKNVQFVPRTWWEGAVSG